MLGTGLVDRGERREELKVGDSRGEVGTAARGLLGAMTGATMSKRLLREGVEQHGRREEDDWEDLRPYVT